MSVAEAKSREKVADCTLVQKSAITGEERSFEIYNRKFLRVNVQHLRHGTKYDLRLGMMEPWPIRHRRISWRSLGVLILALIAGAATTAWFYFNLETVGYSWAVPIIAGLLLLNLGALLVFFLRSPNITEFRSRYGGCVLISLFYNKPDSETFAEFVESLKNRILVASQELAANKSQMLALELKELRRLTSEGIVSDTDYSRAKDRIFKLHGNS